MPIGKTGVGPPTNISACALISYTSMHTDMFMLNFSALPLLCRYSASTPTSARVTYSLPFGQWPRCRALRYASIVQIHDSLVSPRTLAQGCTQNTDTSIRMDAIQVKTIAYVLHHKIWISMGELCSALSQRLPRQVPFRSIGAFCMSLKSGYIKAPELQVAILAAYGGTRRGELGAGAKG